MLRKLVGPCPRKKDPLHKRETPNRPPKPRPRPRTGGRGCGHRRDVGRASGDLRLQRAFVALHDDIDARRTRPGGDVQLDLRIRLRRLAGILPIEEIAPRLREVDQHLVLVVHEFDIHFEFERLDLQLVHRHERDQRHEHRMALRPLGGLAGKAHLDQLGAEEARVAVAALADADLFVPHFLVFVARIVPALLLFGAGVEEFEQRFELLPLDPAHRAGNRALDAVYQIGEPDHRGPSCKGDARNARRPGLRADCDEHAALSRTAASVSDGGTGWGARYRGQCGAHPHGALEARPTIRTAGLRRARGRGFRLAAQGGGAG